MSHSQASKIKMLEFKKWKKIIYNWITSTCDQSKLCLLDKQEWERETFKILLNYIITSIQTLD